MKELIKNGLIHCHTQNSKKDSALSAKRLVERAKELGCPAITLTNHGVMIDIFEFMKECAKNEIKGIPGVECYYKETENIFKDQLTLDLSLTKRNHVLLLAKDEIGYKAILKIVAESYKNLDKGRTETYPCINFKILEKYLGKNTEGYGHVFVTSACMAGVPASILLSNEYIKRDIEKLEKKLKKYNNPNAKSYLANVASLKVLEEEYKEIMDNKKETAKISKKPTAAKEKKVASLKAKKDIEKYTQAKEELDELKKSISKAKKDLEKIEKALQTNKQKQALLKAKIKEESKSHDKYNITINEINKLKEAIYDEKVLYNDAKKYAHMMQNLLGKENYYIELQYHKIEEEAYVMPILANIAKELNIPVVAANDIHIATNSEEDILARHIQRCLRFNKWDGEPSESDKELYIKTDYELSSTLKMILNEDIVNEAMNGVKTIIDNCNGKLPNGTHYPKYKGLINGETSDGALERLCRKNISWRFPNIKNWDAKHEERLVYELGVMKEMDVSDYHLIVQDYLDYGRLLGKLPDNEIQTAPLNKEELKTYLVSKGYDVGLGIGPGRGSGVGSLVCYLLGITAIDPLDYDLLFERFLNIERVSMPDIDSDFKTDIREKCVDYLRFTYGDEAVCRINTKGTQAAKAAIRNCARILGDRYGEQSYYLELGDNIAKAVPKDANLIDATSILEETFNNNEKAMEVIKWAKTVEGCVTQFGIHAGGVIITDGNPVSEYVPMMFEEEWKTQCDMIEAEEHGLLKMDFLGLNNLNVITDTLRLIKQRHGITIDAETVPIELDVFKHVFSTGRTNGVFQFESVGMKSMLKQFKPDCFEDIILLVAAYRPGPLQYLSNIIDIKNGRKELTYLTPELEPILKTTYGSIIYQEQVMRIFQDLAGYSLGQADLVRRAMSKKKTEVLEKERTAFINGDKDRNIKGCAVNNITPEVANELFSQMIEFAKYAFNKSHATAYALVSYITAYLKHYYSIEYICALMMNIKKDKIQEKIPGLSEDLLHYGIELLPPDLNHSESNFSILDNNIVFGLGNIKGVGVGADPIIEERSINGNYTSFKNFLKRIGYNTKKDVTEGLIKAGALDIFCGNRAAMTAKAVPMASLISKIKKNDIKLAEKQAIEEKNKKVLNEIDKLIEANDELKKLLALEKLNTSIEDNDRLIKEKELTGLFLSASPLDDYKTPRELNCLPISEVFESTNTLMGLITNLRITKRKSDGKPMAFFDLEDGTGVISVCCFTKAYEKNKGMIEEGKVVKIKGSIKEKNDDFISLEEENDISFELWVDTVYNLEKSLPDLLISVDSIENWMKDIYPYINKQGYKTQNGYKLFIMDNLFNELRVANFEVSQGILKDKKLNPIIKKN